MKYLKAFIKKHFSSAVFFYSYLGKRLFIIVALSVMVGIFDGFGIAMFIPLLQKIASNEESTEGPETLGPLDSMIEYMQNAGYELTLPLVLVIMLTFFCLKGIAGFSASYYSVLLRANLVTRTRYELVEKISFLQFQAFSNMNAGRIQNVLTGEMIRLTGAVNHYFALMREALLLIVYLGLALSANPQFAFLVILGAAFSNTLYRYIFKTSKRLSIEFSYQGHIFQGLLIQSIDYFKYLKATNGIEGYSLKLKKSVDNLEGIQKKLGFYNSLLSASREIIVILVIVVVIIIQIKFFNSPLSGIILSLLFFYRGLNSLITIQNSWNKYLNNIGAVNTVQETFKELNAKQEENTSHKEVIEFTNQLELRDVTFCYEPNKNIIENFNLSIAKNEVIAFVGSSGSGKTTIANIIATLLYPTKGQILLDGKSILDGNLSAYRSRIGYITQEPIVFNDTVFNNITLWDKNTPENHTRFLEAIKGSHLEETIANLSNQEETQLGDKGIVLSGGQRQRFAIARELYKGCDILIMDEATSALDSETEAIIKNNIDELKGQFTMIIIAHRLSTIRNADRIVFLNNGKIEAIDDFDGLIHKSPQFSRLVQLQGA